MPDWLSRVRDRARKETGLPSDLFGAKNDDADEADWLKGLQQDSAVTGDSETNDTGSFGTGDEDWLSRLGGDSAPAAPTSTTPYTGSESGAPDGLADWLSGISESEETPAAPAAADDWSSGLNNFSFGEDAPAAPQSQQPAESEDDWMKNLSSWQTPGDSSESSGQIGSLFDESQEQNVPSWGQADWGASQPADDQSSGLPSDFSFDAFQQNESSETPWGAPSAGQSSEAEQTGSDFDWMRSLGVSDSAAQTNQPGSDELPDWGLNFAEDQPGQSAGENIFATQATEEPAAEGDLPDWLQGMQAASAIESAMDQPQASSQPSDFDDTELPAWFQDIESDSGAGTPSSTVADTSPSPDWGAASEPASQEDLPDWLRSDEPAQAAPAAELNAADFGATDFSAGQDRGESDLSNWFSSFDSQTSETGASAEAAVSPEPAGESELPDFFQTFGQAQEVQGVDNLPTGEAAAPQDMPDWLAGDFVASEAGSEQDSSPFADLPGAAFTYDTPAAEAETNAAGESSLPDWFSSFEEPASAAETPAFAQPAQAAEQPAASAEDEQPAWLSELGAASGAFVVGQEADSTSSEQPANPFVEEDVPDWLAGFQGQPEQKTSTPALIPMDEQPVSNVIDNKPFEMDLPEWLNEETAQDSPEPAAQQAGANREASAADDLATAELPSWVQAMRPIETAMSDDAGAVESDQRIEKAGPLAGMRGVLPAEEPVIHYRKPPVYSAKLRVTEKQRSQSTVMDGVLARETKSLPIPQVSSHASRILARAMLALFLIILLFGAYLVNLELLATPQLKPPEMLAMYEQINALPAGSKVLVAFEYEPGLSGEMRLVATGVLDHLMQKDAQMVVVSTVPTGPVMANDLLGRVALRNPQYTLAQNVQEPFYLPGGTSSLLEFASNPRRAIPQVDIFGARQGKVNLLSGINSVQDFDQVIVLTDRAEVGRAWVEQVVPYLGQKPILMVTSAQAGPLMQPFVQSQQVKGMVSGMLGGVQYGQLTNRVEANGETRRYWGAYQAGGLLAFVLVLGGGVISGAFSMFQRKPKGKA